MDRKVRLLSNKLSEKDIITVKLNIEVEGVFGMI